MQNIQDEDANQEHLHASISSKLPSAWFSRRWWAMTQDIFICHSCGEGVLIASSGGNGRDSAGRHPAMHQQLPTVQKDLAPNVSLAETGKSWPKETQKQGRCIFKKLVICFDFFSYTKYSLPSLICNSWVGILFLKEASPNCIVSDSQPLHWDCPCTGSLGSLLPIPGFPLAISLLCCLMPIHIDML